MSKGLSTLATAITQAMEAIGQDPEREAEWQRQLEADATFERETKRAAALHPIRDQLPPEMFRALVKGESLKRTKALDGVTQWLTTPDAPPVLVLAGPTGSGKTVAMAYALAELEARWITCTQLTRRSVANFGDEAEEYESTLRARALCVDDVGTERMAAEPVTSMLVELLEKRQSTRTVITTNLSGSDFVKRYGDARLRSRLLRVRWVACQGEDMRRAK